MTMQPNSSSSHSQGVQENPESLNGGVLQPHDPPPTEEIQLNSGESWEIETRNSVLEDHPSHFSGSVLVLSAMALMILGLGIDNITLGYVSAVATLAISLRLL